MSEMMKTSRGRGDELGAGLEHRKSFGIEQEAVQETRQSAMLLPVGVPSPPDARPPKRKPLHPFIRLAARQLLLFVQEHFLLHEGVSNATAHASIQSSMKHLS